MKDIGLSVCAVCKDTKSKTSGDDWYWTVQNKAMYYFCCPSCKDVFFLCPLPYEKNTVPKWMANSPHKTYYDYWGSSFPEKRI